MHARTGKLFGVAVASAAIVFAGTAVTAQAEEPTTPNMVIPEPKGSGCEAVKSVASGPGSLAVLSKAQSSTALASIPEISTFSELVSGQLNPAVNVAAVLDNGPYIVFAPSNEAFAKLTPEQLETLKTDPVAATATVYYHMALGILTPNDIEGIIYTQQGKPVTVKGDENNLTVNEQAKVTCGGIGADHMRVYIIDTVLDPNTAPASVTPTTTSGSATTTTSSSAAETTTSATPTSGAAETPVTVTVTQTAAG
ncbi:fasciclin domain-containing protein [Mycolicibacterium neoaurum]|uniref:Beta-Ig-H3/fasciclin n=1 Tax=Mycolicibacterium neoaurum TaxID=1795 RepID=A0AAV2WNC5_MYCNE|nr:fasciclin domain-containing protein [Mycolicibacterium neoaurum]QVI29599.1 fasciclin domain-containing protein [Mycolicibacterium neoaurum]TLH57941.1 fasciclin [Mycolicibacterium neoaurum]CDQ45735.1 beta-Ig-H3/fasciclin [Mycolicibacterium neoaurum]